MKKLKVNLSNCFGIKHMEYVFDFTSSKVNSIYAPNGTMKTSFTKTFKCIAEDIKPVDLINVDEKSICTIKDNDEKEINKESLLVIESYKEEFKVDRVTTLMASEKLKKKYDFIYNSLEKEKDNLLSSLAKLSGIRKKEEVLEELVNSWGLKEKDFYEILSGIIESRDRYNLPVKLKYKDIINDKVKEFVQEKENITLLNEYIEKFDELISKSKYFEKGVFTHNNVEDISKNLMGNGFFKVKKIKNSLTINEKQICGKEELDNLIKEEKGKILNDESLLKSFNALDDKLTRNAKLLAFRNLIQSNPEIISYLFNWNILKQQLWGKYILELCEQVECVIKEYNNSKESIKKILEESKKEKTLWNDVINIYNDRFDVPFIVEVDNKEDVILKETTPIIKFKYKVGDSQKNVNNELLLKVLSTGEKRALYILNIIFEIEALKKLNRDTLVIVDDIADSFDYRNKYAIIEYLNDILKSNIFNMIVLTHNFDFYRTLKSRLNIKRENCLMAQKDESGIKLVEGGYFNNIFNIWKNNLNNDRILIASIAFVRNLCEYLEEKNSVNYIKLTSLLHLKEDTENLTVEDLEIIYQQIWKIPINLKDKERKVISIINKEADKIIVESSESVNLENKIVLSIAIRLLAEKFMINTINNEEKIKKIKKNQTTGLYSIIKKENLVSKEVMALLEQVNIMTPENIHINSFMFEPILDLSDNHLKKLYCKLKELLSEAYEEVAGTESLTREQ
ncbi:MULTISPECIES: hypothetical protein [Clostridium]|jgi:hypothetical protein|nr:MULTISPECIES: hypothetical protein [Clostridium]MDU6363063.1 hypothetical protein [Clostridium sp.]